MSLNIGQPRKVSWQGKDIITSIYKKPSNELQAVTNIGLINDTQSDKKYHGGWDKALYSYDMSYYDYWRKTLKRNDLEPGMFGENLSTVGMPDHEIYAGDIFELGSIIIQAIQPRFPCARLNLRFNDSTMVKQFAHSKRHGIYYKVLKEGALQVGDTIQKVEKSEIAITIEDIVHSYYDKKNNLRIINAINEHPLFPESLKKDFK